jgi:hypothetical protein
VLVHCCGLFYKWDPRWREEKRSREERKKEEGGEKKGQKDIEGGNGVISETEENSTGLSKASQES